MFDRPSRRARQHLRRRAAVLWIALLATLLVGCGTLTPASQAPTAAPTPIGTVNLTPPPGSLTPTAAIEFLVASMAAHVQVGDKAGYLELIDLSDPAFGLEHSRLADEWATLHPVPDYQLAVSNVSIDGGEATGDLTASWTNFQGEPRTATWRGTFRNGAVGWRYAGEDWITTEVPHFTIKYAPGLEEQLENVTQDLPAIYDHVVDTLDYTPAGTLQIKLYADAAALGANTLLSLPDINGWNEPGEALKLRYNAEDPYLTPTIAHEMTHFTNFDRAGTKRTKMPWWLDEGIAVYVSRKFALIRQDNDTATEAVAAWNANGELVDWDRMAVYETTPQELWQFVYPQGYVMVRYVSTTFGRDRRNQWLARMATEMDIDQATPAVLGMSFDDLDKAFREWLTQVH
jgi:hypothetical protein